jgi:hypothetical protein
MIIKNKIKKPSRIDFFSARCDSPKKRIYDFEKIISGQISTEIGAILI